MFASFSILGELYSIDDHARLVYLPQRETFYDQSGKNKHEKMTSSVEPIYAFNQTYSLPIPYLSTHINKGRISMGIISQL